MDNINTTPVLTEPHSNARAEILRLQSIGEHATFAATGQGQVWDYSFSRPNLNGTPIVGVCRYLDYLPNGKVINSSELAQILSLNKVVLFNWENGATDMRGGANTGAAHGKEANRQLDALGIPKDVPIIYSADWDVQGNEYAAVEAYLRAAAAQGRPVGVYGKNDMVHQMLTRGAAIIGWVTLAWQYNQPVTPLAHLYQDGVNSPNGTDHNIILKTNWGFYPNTSPNNNGDNDMFDQSERDKLDAVWGSVEATDAAKDPNGKPMNDHWATGWIWTYVQGIDKRLGDIEKTLAQIAAKSK